MKLSPQEVSIPLVSYMHYKKNLRDVKGSLFVTISSFADSLKGNDCYYRFPLIV